MKKVLMMAGAFFLGAVTLFGQEMVRMERFMGEELTGIDVSVLDVEIRQGAKTGVVIEIENDERLISNFYCKMEKPGIVKMGMYARSKQNVKAYVTVSRLDLLHATNSSMITPAGSFTSPGYCNVSLYNNARMDGLEVTADSVRVKSSMGAKVSGLRVQGDSYLLIHASGGGDLSCNDVFKAGYAEVWAATGDIHNLQLQVKDADIHAIKGGNIRGLTVNATGRVTVMADDYADINFEGNSQAEKFELEALNSALVTGVDMQAGEIRLSSNYYSSIEPAKLDSRNPLQIQVRNRSQIKGGGVDEVNPDYSGRSTSRSCFWVSDRNYRQDKDVEMVRLTRFLNQRICGLKADDFFRINMQQGENTGIEIVLPEECLNYLTCTIEQGNIVHIGYGKLPSHLRQSGNWRGKNWSMDNRPVINITVNCLDQLRLSGMCHFHGEGHFTSSGKVTIEVSEMSNIHDLWLDAQAVDLRCNTLGKADVLVLHARDVNLSVSDLSKIKVEDADIGTLRMAAHAMSKIRIAGRAETLASLVSEAMSKIDYRELNVKKH